MQEEQRNTSCCQEVRSQSVVTDQERFGSKHQQTAFMHTTSQHRAQSQQRTLRMRFRGEWGICAGWPHGAVLCVSCRACVGSIVGQDVCETLVWDVFGSRHIR